MLQKCLLAGVMALFAISCSDSTGPAVPEELELGASGSITMIAGSLDTITIVVRDASGNLLNDLPVNWASSNNSVARVNPAGIITADSSGTATITASLDQLHGSFDVTVVQTLQSLFIELGDTVVQMSKTMPLRVFALDGARRPFSANLDLSYSTSDSSVFFVDSTGTVHGTGWGKAVITVQADTISASVTLHSVPMEVDLAGVELVNFELGSDHICGQDVAGELYCWGSNAYGQLGLADTLTKSVTAPAIVPGASHYVQYAAGFLHSCGLTAEGEIWCWGLNNRAELGQGFSGPPLKAPVKVSGNHVWSYLTAESQTVCGITDSNVPYCWGENRDFQLGRAPGASTDLLVAPVSGGYQMTAIDLSQDSGCGLDPGGQPLCWGQDVGGAHPDPRAIVAPPLVSIFAGTGENECGLTTTGEAWCWGNTPDGVLGTKTNTDAVAFAPNLRFVMLALSSESSCGITTEGELYCWGSQYPWPGIMPGSLTRFGEPGTNFIDVDVSTLFPERTCALTSEHRLYCW